MLQYENDNTNEIDCRVRFEEKFSREPKHCYISAVTQYPPTSDVERTEVTCVCYD